MSSLDLRRFLRIGILLAAAGLGGCLRPLYGPTASGERMDDVLASIQVAPIAAPFGQESLGHYLRSELVFDLDGSGRPPPKLYNLEVQVSERSQSPLVDTETGRADSATLFGEADYTLTSRDGSRVIAKGRVSGSATYDRSTQRFAAVRAARDAEIRLSKLLSEQIKTRLAAGFVSRAPL
jgi:LPS-assembly lipoprotein